MIYIHKCLYLYPYPNIELGKRESIKQGVPFGLSYNFSFLQLHTLTLKSINRASKAVNQRKSLQLKIPNNC